MIAVGQPNVWESAQSFGVQTEVKQAGSLCSGGEEAKPLDLE